MYSERDLTLEGNIKFIEDCCGCGIDENLAKDVIGVLTYNGYKLFKYDLAGMLNSYYVIGETSVKLNCVIDDVYKIVELAINEVIIEIEFGLKENYTLGSDEPNALNYLGTYLETMLCNCVHSPIVWKNLSTHTKLYSRNLIKIASTEF